MGACSRGSGMFPEPLFFMRWMSRDELLRRYGEHWPLSKPFIFAKVPSTDNLTKRSKEAMLLAWRRYQLNKNITRCAACSTKSNGDNIWQWKLNEGKARARWHGMQASHRRRRS